MGELRIRNVPKQLTDKFKKVEQHFKVVESTKAIEMLIHQFFEDQQTIASQKKAIQDLSALVANINNERARIKQSMQYFLDAVKASRNSADYFIRTGTGIIKKFGTNKRKKVPAGKRSKTRGK